MMGDLSDEAIQKLDEQREAFFKSTQDLRQNIYQKQLALESEFAKKNPDAKIAKNLQKEISDLRAQIDQKRIENMIEMKEINPAIGAGFMGPGMMGYGHGSGFRGYGHMMGGPSFDLRSSLLAIDQHQYPAIWINLFNRGDVTFLGLIPVIIF